MQTKKTREELFEYYCEQFSDHQFSEATNAAIWAIVRAHKREQQSGAK